MQNASQDFRASQGAPFPQRPRAKYSRTTNGCLNCRRRRKRCDQQQPYCIACQRNKLLCVWSDAEGSAAVRSAPEMPRTTYDQSSAIYRAQGTNVTAGARPATMGFPHVHDTLLLTQWSTMLYDHWFHRTSTNMCTLFPPNNAFHTYVVQSATSDTLLLHTLLTVSGMHLNFNDTASLEVKRTIFAHYRATLQGIRQEVDRVLSEPHVSCLRLALILLLVCHAEVSSMSQQYDCRS